MTNIITIGREMGSGGRTIGKLTAKKLGIPYYDRELIDAAAKESGLSPEFIEQNEQQITGSFLYNLAMGNSYTYGMLGMAGGNTLPLTMQVFIAQQKVILEYAKEPCVLVGRCADFILREKENLLKVFIYSTLEKRIERAIEHYEVDRKKAMDLIAKSDKGRARHYATFTDYDWGDRSHYDLMINSGTVGLEGAADIICACARQG